jgi:dolichol-phosphate mannosyltransferase
MKKLSIVVPFYYEEECAEYAYERLHEVVTKLDYDYEFIFVNDGSRDQTLAILKGIANEDKKVKLISFSRNFGHQAAVTAGLKWVTGDVCVIIDADMQDPPECIPDMLKLWEAGNMVVYGQRKSRAGESQFKLLTAKAFYSLLNKLADVEIPQNTGDFRLVDRKVVDELNALPEHNKFLRGLWSWLGYQQKAFEYERAERYAGETHYPLKKMLKLAGDGIFGFSKKPVTFIGIAGVVLMVLSMLFLLGGIISAIVGGMAFVWLILMGVNFVGGILMICLFFIGQYLIRISDDTKNRPQFVVDETMNF